MVYTSRVFHLESIKPVLKSSNRPSASSDIWMLSSKIAFYSVRNGKNWFSFNCESEKMQSFNSTLRYCPSKRDRCYHTLSRDSSCRPHELLKLGTKDVVFKTSGDYQYVEITVNGKTGTRTIPFLF